MHLTHNERTELTATWFNTLATALVAAGGFAPGAALFWGLSPPAIGAAYMLVAMFGCFALGLSLHFAGRAFLRRLRE